MFPSALRRSLVVSGRSLVYYALLPLWMLVPSRVKENFFRALHRSVFRGGVWSLFLAELHRRGRVGSVRKYWAEEGIHNHRRRYAEEKGRMEEILLGQRYLHHALHALLTHEKVDAVIEIGCGNGLALDHYAQAYPEASFYGLDIEDATIRFCRETYHRPNMHFLLGTFRDLAGHFRGQRALIFSRATLYHFHETELHDLDQFLSQATGLESVRYLGEYPVDQFYAGKIDPHRYHPSESRRSVTLSYNHNYLYSLSQAGFPHFEYLTYAPEGPERPQHLFWCASDREVPLKLSPTFPFVAYEAKRPHCQSANAVHQG